MGATNFYLFRRVTPQLPSLQALYQDACDEAIREHGNSGYNGTISTTAGVRLHQHTPVTRSEADRIAERDYEQYDKWEACGAIPVLPDGNVTSRTVQGWLTLDGPGQWHEREADIKAAVLAGKWGLKSGESVLEWAQDVASPTYDPVTFRRIEPERAIQVTRKVIVEATEGKTETRYFIQGPRLERVQWEHGHPTQAAARAALKKWLEDGNGETRPPTPADPDRFTIPYLYEVVPMTRRASGEAVVRAWSEVVKTRYPIKVTVGTVNRTGEIAGYLFFGMVAM